MFVVRYRTTNIANRHHHSTVLVNKPSQGEVGKDLGAVLDGCAVVNSARRVVKGHAVVVHAFGYGEDKNEHAFWSTLEKSSAAPTGYSSSLQR